MLFVEDVIFDVSHVQGGPFRHRLDELLQPYENGFRASPVVEHETVPLVLFPAPVTSVFAFHILQRGLFVAHVAWDGVWEIRRHQLLLALSSETGLAEHRQNDTPVAVVYPVLRSVIDSAYRGSSLKSNLSPISFDSLDNCHCLSLRPSVARRMTSSFV